MHIYKHAFLLAIYLLHIYLVVKLLTHWLCICSVLIFIAQRLSKVAVLINLPTNSIQEFQLL